MTQLAILSDTHDQIANLQAAIRYCNENGVDVVAHCGDLISPFMLKQLGKFNGAVHLVYGNNVGDQHLISTRCETEYPNITHHGVFGDFSVDDYRIGLTHYPNQAERLASQSAYDIVCYGHSHKNNIGFVDQTLLINPGHMLGEDEHTGFYIINLLKWSVQRIGTGLCMFDHELPVIEGTPQPIRKEELKKTVKSIQ